jgi:hypothetical protein
MTIRNDAHGMEVQAARPGKTQNIALSGASQVCSPFQVNKNLPLRPSDGSTIPTTAAHTTHVRIVSTGACWLCFGAGTPIASATNGLSFYMPANVPEYFWVVPGEVVAVINDGSSSGTVNIAEMVQ